MKVAQMAQFLINQDAHIKICERNEEKLRIMSNKYKAAVYNTGQEGSRNSAL